MININKLQIILLALLTGLILFISFTSNKTITNPVTHELDSVTEEKGPQINLDIPEESNPYDLTIDSKNETVDLPETPVFAKEIHIVAIGDSITKGVGDELNKFGYVGILTDKLNTINQIVTIDNYGVTGNRSDQLLKRLDKPEIIENIENADTVFITIGSNDILQIFKKNFINLDLDQFSDEQDEYRERITNILEEIKDINDDTSIYLIGFYNPFKTFFTDIDEVDFIVDHWNNIGYEVTTQYEDVHYIPTKDLYTGPASTYLSDDNFHLNHNGYQKMANRILDSLLENEGNTYEQHERYEE